MPTTVAYIECGKNIIPKDKPGVRTYTPPFSCKGHLEVFAHTGVRHGMQYGDPSEHTFFLICPECGKIYYTEYTDAEDDPIRDFDIANPGRLQSYEGKLTKQQIIDHAKNELAGHYSEWKEKDLLAKIAPENWNGRAVVQGLQKFNFTCAVGNKKDFAIVEVPNYLVGYEVEIKVIAKPK